MAEITTPKPYRDFYVTNPFVCMQNDVQSSTETLHTHIRDLQKIVSTGYIAEEPFESHVSQVVTFEDEKHGFSLTNDLSLAATYQNKAVQSINWEQGSLSTLDGLPSASDIECRQLEYIPIMGGTSYTFSITAETSDYVIKPMFYDSNKTFLPASMNFLTFPATFNATAFPLMDIKYLRFRIRKSDQSNVTAEEVAEAMVGFTVTAVNYTAPNDATVKVAENIPISLNPDDWESGSISSSSGALLDKTDATMRTKTFIRVRPNQIYQAYYTSKEGAGYVWTYCYDENQNFLSLAYTGGNNVHTFKTNSNVAYIKVVITNTMSQYNTPELAINNVSRLTLTTEPMIVAENDTRIVTMQPFTELYVESNVPYHGHALDLLETE